MNMALVIAYISVAVAFGVWTDAMDRRYGAELGAASSWIAVTVLAVMWPLGLPLSMVAIANGGWGRWKLKAE